MLSKKEPTYRQNSAAGVGKEVSNVRGQARESGAQRRSELARDQGAELILCLTMYRQLGQSLICPVYRKY